MMLATEPLIAALLAALFPAYILWRALMLRPVVRISSPTSTDCQTHLLSQSLPGRWQPHCPVPWKDACDQVI
ncbi:uncharacterized protein B0H18DRAFT_1012008 [Fomitopsis serialis]|uniref:uncharacterized protein n=1 Tax=Fomitopsis serialis TaxID=139415 RepID=UPI002007DDBE|nr:uncharacterized protein B0H18DRAFT_1023355 [Neoantrodia serialis]XP_047892448.1 uncharacterized protein B0H18DRAFT_1012008 [Neoantrodia serialis]KAH9920716.1 hypothetical protein B0H18DRAFT_1023355 [Neoantrodia serialis]KAH9924404.1 hypothetical protein B0H18DRAFT_1012008 [Neoantrodia serialis]